MCVSLLWVSFVAITGVLTLLGKKNPNRHLTLSRTLLFDTLVGHSTWHSCGTLTLYLTRLLDTCIWHGFWRAYSLALLLDTIAWHSCGMLIFDTFVGHSYLALLWDILIWHSDFDTLAYLTHVYAGHPHMTIPGNTLLDTLTWHIWSARHWEPPTTVSQKSVPQKCRAIVSSKGAK